MKRVLLLAVVLLGLACLVVSGDSSEEVAKYWMEIYHEDNGTWTVYVMYNTLAYVPEWIATVRSRTLFSAMLNATFALMREVSTR